MRRSAAESIVSPGLSILPRSGHGDLRSAPALTTRRRGASLPTLWVVAAALAAWPTSLGWAQSYRGDSDRPSYQPPLLQPQASAPANRLRPLDSGQPSPQLVRPDAPLHEVETGEVETAEPARHQVERHPVERAGAHSAAPGRVAPAAYGEPYIESPAMSVPYAHADCGAACGPTGCDSIGCDALSCGPVGPACGLDGCTLGCCNPGVLSGDLCLTPNRLFGSAEVLLWWRRPQSLPPLVTTSPTGTAADVAGQLGEDTTRILFGDDRYGDTVAAGGRIMVGMWLDDQGCQSITGRFWGTGRENYRFDADSVRHPILARPFLDVTDGQLIEQNTNLVAFPGTFSGRVGVRGTSEVLGADVALRQLCRSGLGGTVDTLWGYQTLRINEGLAIRSHSTVIETGGTLPVGSTIAIGDRFDTRNEFHGAQFGLAGRFHDRCWTYDGLIKLGVGRLNRRAILRGETTTTSGAQQATVDEGLLVRSTNAGTYSDGAFSVVPELMLSMGYRIRPNLDLSFGYSLIVVTNAIQPWRAIDRDLAVNLADPPMVEQRPEFDPSFGSYWVQGMQFGLHWNY